MNIKQKARNIHVIKADYSKDIQTSSFLLSDTHYDSKHCDRVLLKKHLDKALKKNANILIGGDWFDLMGAKRDPRSVTGDIRPEYTVSNYLDSVIDDSYEFLKPYKDNMFFSYGNHETSIIRHKESDPLKRLTGALYGVGNTDARIGGYAGWIIYKFQHTSGSNRITKVQHYHHGFGGNAKRSKGILEADLNAKKYPNAHIINHGHIHQKWHVPLKSGKMFNVNNSKIVDFTQHHLCTGTYKDGVEDEFGGWENEKGFDSSVLGGWEVTFTYSEGDIKLNISELN